MVFSSLPHSRPAKFLWIIAITVSMWWLVLRSFGGIDWSEFFGVLRETNKLYFLPYLFLIALLAFVRAMRWSYILRPFLPKASIALLYRGIILGFLANTLLPGSPGPLVRAYIAAKHLKRSVSSLLASTLVGRLIDGWSFLALIIIVLFVIPLPPTLTGFGQHLQWAGTVSAVLYLLGTLFLVALRRYSVVLQKTSSLCEYCCPMKWREKLRALIKAFPEGLVAGRSPWDWTMIVLLSLLHRFLLSLPMLVMALALGVTTLPLTLYLFLQIFLGFINRIAGSLGIQGSFEAGTIAILSLYAIPTETALAIGLLVHVGSSVSVFLLGGLASVQEGVALRTLKDISVTTENVR